MNELIQKLMGDTGVNAEQAQGGAGLILAMAKEKLGAGDFSKLSGMVPGLDSLAAAAPSGDAAGGGGLMGAIGGLAGGLGGGGGLASLASGFSSLGIDPSQITQFVPSILGFVQDKGGADAKGLLEKVLA